MAWRPKTYRACADCPMQFLPSGPNVKRCKVCQEAASRPGYNREARAIRYQRLKRNPEQLEQHRRWCREANQRRRQRAAGDET